MLRSTEVLEVRLRTLILADAAITASGAIFSFAMYAITGASDLLLWIGAFVGVLSITMAIGLVPLRNGNINAALAWLCGANWAAAIVVSAVATFTWPLQLQTALLPAAIATAFVPRTQLVWYAVVSFATAVAAAGLGLLQDFTGMTDAVPEWSRTLVLLFFAPLLAGLVMLVALQNSVRLQTALTDALHSQVALADRADQLRMSRSRLVAATDRERRRIERDLHDGAQSRLVAINLRLSHARSQLRSNPDEADVTLELVRHELHLAQTELRDLAHGVYPTVLTQHGLVPAIQAAADHAAIPVRLDVQDVGRHPASVEAAFYFCVLEALQNAAKHSRADTVLIRLERTSAWLRFDVADDGVGLATENVDGVGIDNMRDRLGAVGGLLSIESTPGGGTTVRGHLDMEEGT